MGILGGEGREGKGRKQHLKLPLGNEMTNLNSKGACGTTPSTEPTHDESLSQVNDKAIK